MAKKKKESLRAKTGGYLLLFLMISIAFGLTFGLMVYLILSKNGTIFNDRQPLSQEVSSFIALAVSMVFGAAITFGIYLAAQREERQERLAKKQVKKAMKKQRAQAA